MNVRTLIMHLSHMDQNADIDIVMLDSDDPKEADCVACGYIQEVDFQEGSCVIIAVDEKS